MKKILIGMISIVIVLLGSYLFINMNNPLIADSFAWSTDEKVQLITLGNNSSFGEIKIEKVLVNNEEIPSTVAIQVSDHENGFIISDQVDGEEEKEFVFDEIDSVFIKTNTNPQKLYEQLDAGKEIDEDVVYALTIGYVEKIHRVIITYRHLGLSREVVIPTR